MPPIFWGWVVALGECRRRVENSSIQKRKRIWWKQHQITPSLCSLALFRYLLCFYSHQFLSLQQRFGACSSSTHISLPFLFNFIWVFVEMIIIFSVESWRWTSLFVLKECVFFVISFVCTYLFTIYNKVWVGYSCTLLNVMFNHKSIIYLHRVPNGKISKPIKIELDRFNQSVLTNWIESWTTLI